MTSKQGQPLREGTQGLWWNLAARKDFLGGVLMLVLGMATAMQAASYNIGSLRRMGPGFFPLSLGIILAIVGMLIIATAKRPDSGPVAELAPEWRGWLCICAGVGAFVVIGQYGGLVPATFAIVFISAQGDRQNSLIDSAVLAAAMTGICVVVFWWLLQVPFPLFHWD
jgi:hypothetical protein